MQPTTVRLIQVYANNSVSPIKKDFVQIKLL